MYRGLNSVIIHPTHPIIPSINYNINHRVSSRFAKDVRFDEISRLNLIRHLLTRRIAWKSWKCRAHVFGAYSVTFSGVYVPSPKYLFAIPSMTHNASKINMLVGLQLKINNSRHSFLALTAAFAYSV